MRVKERELIKANMEKALKTQSKVICILKNGLTELEHIYDPDPMLYTKITFVPKHEIDGYYCGLMYYPNNKCQGLMDFTLDSFLSVIYLDDHYIQPKSEKSNIKEKFNG